MSTYHMQLQPLGICIKSKRQNTTLCNSQASTKRFTREVNKPLKNWVYSTY
jgi:hypothetical protein